MKWFEHCSLSEADMEWLAGTHTMEKLVRYKLILMFEADAVQPTFDELGCYEINNPFYMHRKNDETLEFYFSEKEDLDLMKEKFTVAKMSA